MEYEWWVFKMMFYEDFRPHGLRGDIKRHQRELKLCIQKRQMSIRIGNEYFQLHVWGKRTKIR